MSLAHLVVLNRSGSAAPAPSAGELLADGCIVDTCLREVRVASLPAAAQPPAIECQAAGFERHTGAEAYRFLLELACGLESEIAGETEILGQVKEAWRRHEAAQPSAAALLRPWMQRLLQDTKEIRSEYVVGLGSATYGSLVRRLLGADAGGTTLLLGAGQLAEAVLPYLDGAVTVANRHRGRAEELIARQRMPAQQRYRAIEGGAGDEELAAWRQVRNVVICIPADAAHDAARVAAWRSRLTPGSKVLHLGIHDPAGSAWERIEGLATLRELFGLRDAQATLREALLARARRACFTKAQLARLDDADGARPGSASHGWEDLAVFQAFGY
ncbi:MAG: hypothetical protein QM696_11400 [Steroidobacteraceae bacterium]